MQLICAIAFCFPKARFSTWLIYEPHHEKNLIFAYAKGKAQISYADQHLCFHYILVQFLYFLNKKFKASSQLLWLNSLVCVGPGRKTQRQVVFSRWGSYCSLLESDFISVFQITGIRLSSERIRILLLFYRRGKNYEGILQPSMYQ